MLSKIPPATHVIWIITAIICFFLIAAAFGDWRI
jgi:hypothetical protein